MPVTLLAALLLGVPSAAAGQQTASIFGQVTDESGGVLPGVTVTASSPALQLREQTVVTNEQGEYRLTPLPIGTYDVTYALSGFQLVRRDNVRLTVGFAAKLDMIMKLGAVAETITVSGRSPVVDVTSTGTVTALTRETLEAIPTGRAGLVSLMAQAPGTRPQLDVGGNSSGATFHAFGQDGESWQMLEGVAAVSQKVGNQGGQFWDYSSVEEAKVQTIGSQADVPTRGIAINVIIKSGGNSFHGGGFLAQISPKFQSDNINAELAAQGVRSGNPIKTRWDRSGELGGRIIRDKLWFYASERRRWQETYVLNTFKPDGSRATTGSPQGFSTQKLSYQLNQSNRLDGYHQWGSRDNVDSGLNEFVSYDTRGQLTNNTHTAKVEWQSVLSSSLVTSLQFGRWGWRAQYGGYSDQVLKTDQLNQKRSGLDATASSNPGERRYHTKGSVSWITGDHQIKSGFDYMAELQNRPWHSRGAAGNYQLVFRNDVPFQVVAYNYPANPTDLRNYAAIYSQDAWTIDRRLTLNLGLRYARDNAFIPEQCRDAVGPPTNIVVIPATCYPKVQFKIFNAVVPRLHAAYDVRGDGKTVVKGGWGRFMHPHMMDEVGLSNKNSASVTTYNNWRDVNGNNAYDAGEVDFQRDFVSTNVPGGGPPNDSVPNPTIQAPTSDEFFVSTEREVFSNFAVRATGIYSRNTNVYRLQNNKRPYSAYDIPITRSDPGPDGRVGTADDPGTFITYFDYPAAFAGATFQETMLINDPNATQTYRSFEVAASKRLSNSWQFMASFSATKTHNPFVVNTGSTGSIPLAINTFDPNAEIFSANDTWEWLGRASGSYQFPAGILVSGNFEHRSGNPYARTVSATGGQQIRALTVRVEPIGTRHLPNINLLDLRVQKTIDLPAGHSVAVQANLYNSMNISTVTSRTALSGANFLRIGGIVPPRILELAVNYRF